MGSTARMFACVLMAGTLLLAGSGSARAQSASDTTAPDTGYEKTVDLVQPGVVRLLVEWHAYVDTGASDFGKIGPYDFTASCTGFIVNPNGYIVTAGHCVDPSLEGVGESVLTALVQDMVTAEVITAEDAQDPDFLAYAVQNWHIEGEAANSPPDVAVTVAHGISLSGKGDLEGGPARVIEENPPSKGDVALLKVEAQDLPTLLLADPSSVSVGTSVLAVGYSATSDDVTDPSMTATFKDGKVSSQKTREGGLLPVYEVSAALSVGMSGGPTVTLDGKVIGLNSFNPADETQPFNFLSPTALISETLTRNGVKNELGPVDQLYRQGVDAYFSGDYSTAEKRFASVLDQVPSHQQAQKLKALATTKAAANPTVAPTVAPPVAVATSSSSSSTPWLLIAGAAVALVLVVGVAALLLARRKRPDATAVAQAGAVPPMPVGAPMAPNAPTGPYTPTAAYAPTAVASPPAAPYEPPRPVATAPNASPPVETVAPVVAPVAATVAVAEAPASEVAGTEQPLLSVPDAFCGNCGHAVPAEDRFCPGCGNDMHRKP